jgi:hypothetical protein
MVTLKHKDSGQTKELPDHYGEGILLSSEQDRGYELVREKSVEVDGLIQIRKGSDEYKELIQLATDNSITLDEVSAKYKISAAILSELEILLK